MDKITEMRGVPSRRNPMRLQVLLSLAYIIAQGATQIIGLVVVPIENSLHTTDAEMGFLQGFSFILIYTIAGIPVARWIDKGDRIRVVVVSVLLFSIATIVSGLARSFVMLAALRAFTAISEAGLSPAAFAIFSESGSAKRTAHATGFFMLSPFLGAGLALAGGGLLAQTLGHSPFLAGLDFDAPWRTVFLALGLPGLLVAALIWAFCKDPGRSARERKGHELPFAQVLRLVFVEHPFFRSYHAGLASFITFLFGYIAWFPTFLVRHYDMDFSHAGEFAGLTYMTGGVIGTLFSIAMAGRWEKTGVLNGILRWFAASMLAVIPLAIFIPVLHHLALAIILYGIVSFLAASIVSMMVVPIQLILPPGVQGRAIAVFVFLTTAIGGTFGPSIVGALSSRLGLPIGMALVVNGLATTALAAMLIRRARQFGKLEPEAAPMADHLVLHS